MVSSVAPTERAFEVLLTLDDEELGPDAEPLQPGTYLTWPMNRATNNMGTTVESIEFRSGMFQDYLKNRAHAREEWLKIAQQHRLEQGDHVLLPIKRVDRSNTCPKVMEGRVMSVKDNFVRIGTSAGIIETAFHQDQVQKMTGKK